MISLKHSVRNIATHASMYNKMVQASFIHAKHHGFTDEAIAAACKDLELPSVSSSIIKKGPYEIVDFAMEEWLRSLVVDLETYSEVDGEQEIRFKDLDLEK